MKNYNSMYLGICINNDDPQRRGRVQVFVPHIMPALYEGWNDLGEDIQISCVGDNIANGLTSDIVSRLAKILPWAEAATPILGTSAPGNLISGEAIGGAIGGALGAAFGGVGGAAVGAAGGAAVGAFFDQSPVPLPAGSGSGDLAAVAQNMIGTSTANIQGTQGGNVGCAAAVSKIFKNATGQDIIPGKSLVLGTGQLYSHMSSSNDWVKVPINQMQPGDILVTARGSRAGHTGIYAGNGRIISNSSSGFQGSAPGTIQNNYSIDSWKTGVITRNPNESGAFRYIGSTSSTPSTERVSQSGQTAAAANTHQTSEGPPTVTNTDDNNLQGIAADPNVTNNAPQGLPANVALTLTSSQQADVNAFTQNYKNNYGQYQAVSNNLAQQGITMTPAQVASIQWREASGDLTKSIANGQALGTNVRKDGRMGQGSTTNSFTPTTNWTQNATEVLSYKASSISKAVGTTDFSSNKNFYEFAERFNGLGYRNKGATSPYVFSGTNQYTSGKYVADGVYEANTRDKQVGVAALVSAAEGTPIDPASITSPDNLGATIANTNLVNRTNPHGAVATQNLNNMAKGVFSFPAAGAMLWIFFREGNPLYPVYFAASYSASEWQSAYRYGSPGPGYNPSPKNGEPQSTGGVMNLNGVGGIRWEDTNSYSDRTKDQKSLMLFGEDGSNLFFANGYNQLYAKFDKRDQVDGDRFDTTLGYKESWIQGDHNKVVMGDQFVKIGNVSQTAVDAVNEHISTIKEIQAPLSQTA